SSAVSSPGSRPSSSRKRTASTSHPPGPNASTPTLRPAGMPTFSGSSTVRTPSGSSGRGEPLPTTTTSTASPRCLATDSSRARRGGLAGQRQTGGTRLGRRLLDRRQPALVTGDPDEVGLGLDQDRAEGGESAEEGPQPVDPPGAPQVGGAQTEADQDCGVAQV